MTRLGPLIVSQAWGPLVYHKPGALIVSKTDENTHEPGGSQERARLEPGWSQEGARMEP